jgi:hypothetical protein
MSGRNRQRRPVIGGVVNRGRGDTTKQGRKRAAKHDVAEMARIARDDACKKLKSPTGEEVQDVSRTKEK